MIGLAMGPKARRNAARPTGNRAMLDRMAEESCNVERVKDWGAEKCDCPVKVTWRDARSGRTVRTCLEHD